MHRFPNLFLMHSPRPSLPPIRRLAALVVAAVCGNVLIGGGAIAAEPAFTVPAQHMGPIQTLAFSPDGRWLASGGYGDRLIVWDVESRRQQTVLWVGDTVMDSAFSPDGKTVATLTYRGEAAVWDVAAGTKLRSITLGLGKGHEILFSPDGRWLLVAGEQEKDDPDASFPLYGRGLAVVYDVSTGRKRFRKETSSPILSAAFDIEHTDLQLGLLSYSDKNPGRLLVWDYERDERETSYQHQYRWSWSSLLRFVPSGRTFGVVSEMAVVEKTFKVETLPTARGLGQISGIAVDPTGSWLMAFGNSAIEVRDLRSKEQLAFLHPRVQPKTGGPNLGAWTEGKTIISEAALSGDGRRLAIAYSDEQIEIRDLTNGTVGTLEGVETEAVGEVTVSPDSRRLITSYRNHAVEWDLRTGRPSARYDVSRNTKHHDENVVTEAAFTSDGTRLLVSGQYGGSRLYRPGDEAPTGWLRTEEHFHTAAAFAQGGTRVYSGRGDTVVAWDVAAERTVWETDFSKDRRFSGYLRVAQLSVSPDERTLLTVIANTPAGLVQLDAQTGAVLAIDGRGDEISSVSHLSNGSAATGSKTGDLTLWQTSPLRPTRTAKSGDPIKSIAASADGRRIATGHADGTVALWDAETLAKVGEVAAHQGAVSDLAFSADGRRLVSGATDGQAVVIDANASAPLARLVLFSDAADWVVLAANGFVDGSAGGLAALALDSSSAKESGVEATSVEEEIERRSYSGLLTAVWNGDAEAAIADPTNSSSSP